MGKLQLLPVRPIVRTTSLMDCVHLFSHGITACYVCQGQRSDAKPTNPIVYIHILCISCSSSQFHPLTIISYFTMAEHSHTTGTVYTDFFYFLLRNTQFRPTSKYQSPTQHTYHTMSEDEGDVIELGEPVAYVGDDGMQFTNPDDFYNMVATMMAMGFMPPPDFDPGNIMGHPGVEIRMTTQSPIPHPVLSTPLPPIHENQLPTQLTRSAPEKNASVDGQNKKKKTAKQLASKGKSEPHLAKC